MRFVAILFSVVSVTVMLLTVEIVLRLPTDEEIALIGEDGDRSALAQMRLARLIVAVDEERGSYVLASITGVDPDLVQANLRQIARLEEEKVPGFADPPVPKGAEDGPEEEAPRIRQMGNGGARFVRVN